MKMVYTRVLRLQTDQQANERVRPLSWLYSGHLPWDSVGRTSMNLHDPNGAQKSGSRR